MTDTKISPCPMPGCGGECHSVCWVPSVGFSMCCVKCRYHSAKYECEGDSIAVHEKLCERNRLGKLVEAFKKNPPVRGFDSNAKFPDGTFKVAFNDGVRACLDFFKVEVENTDAEGAEPRMGRNE